MSNVFDDFNRANSPGSLGTAPTGQTWANLTTGIWGIASNAANCQVDANAGIAVIDSGFRNTIVQATILDVTAGGNLNALNWGLIFCCSDINNWYGVIFSKSAPNFFRLCTMIGGVFDGSWAPAITTPTPVNGDVLKVANCDDGSVQAYLNDALMYEVLPGTGTWSPNPFLTLSGTKQGLQCGPGIVTPPQPARWDDFSAVSNNACPGTVSYDCTEEGCVDPGDGSGEFATLEECEAVCIPVPVSYNCVDGTCVDPGDGSGEFATLLECQMSGCEAVHTATTEIFDAGEGSAYWLVPQITDSGDELRSKTIKSIRVTGRLTNASAMVYGYDVGQPIIAEDLETGTRTNTQNTTRPQTFTDTTEVTQTERKPINVANAALWTSRIQGDDTGNEERDRIDEIVCEVAQQGVRR